jgi:hypothetical protein
MFGQAGEAPQFSILRAIDETKFLTVQPQRTDTKSRKIRCNIVNLPEHVQLQNFSFRISQVQEYELPSSNYLDRTTLYNNFAQLLTKSRPKRTCSPEVQGSDHLYLTSCRDDDIHQSTMSMPAQDQSRCWENRGPNSTADTNSTACPGAVLPRTRGFQISSTGHLTTIHVPKLPF